MKCAHDLIGLNVRLFESDAAIDHVDVWDLAASVFPHTDHPKIAVLRGLRAEGLKRAHLRCLGEYLKCTFGFEELWWRRALGKHGQTIKVKL